LPTLEQNVVATFADGIAIMVIGDNNSESTEKLQTAVTKMQRWTRTWRIKPNETKSVHNDFTNKRIEHKPNYINHHVVPYEKTAKYLGMTLDAKLRWKPHVKKKNGRTRTEIQKNVLANGSLFGPICI
jgi:uncharacterized protein YpmS